MPLPSRLCDGRRPLGTLHSLYSDAFRGHKSLPYTPAIYHAKAKACWSFVRRGGGASIGCVARRQRRSAARIWFSAGRSTLNPVHGEGSPMSMHVRQPLVRKRHRQLLNTEGSYLGPVSGCLEYISICKHPTRARSFRLTAFLGAPPPLIASHAGHDSTGLDPTRRAPPNNEHRHTQTPHARYLHTSLSLKLSNLANERA